MSSRSVWDLDPRVREKAEAHVQACREAGFDLLIYCTYRSQEEQDIEWAKGRTTPGPKTTWTQHSKHSALGLDGSPAALAYDAVPLSITGKSKWNDKVLIARMGELGQSVGLAWGGRWRASDRVHFEWPS